MPAILDSREFKCMITAVLNYCSGRHNGLVLDMVCIESFDLWRIMRSLKSTKRPASRFSKMVKDLLAGSLYILWLETCLQKDLIAPQISLSITDLQCFLQHIQADSLASIWIINPFLL